MLNVAVVGTGYWGKNHARSYKELLAEGALDKVKVCDASEANLGAVSTALGLEGIADYRQLLADPGIHAVSIITPSKTHYQIAKEFMEAGKDVLVEKPMTMDVREAEDLVDVAARTNRILMVGHLFRYHPAVRELKRRIGLGELGAIQNMISSRLAFGLPRKDMGVIYALGIHEMDMFCYLLNVNYPQKLVAAVTSTYSSDIEETGMISMDFGTAKGYALESWLVPTLGKSRELIVVGSSRSARIDYLDTREFNLFDASIVTENGVPLRAENKNARAISVLDAEPLKEEIRHFLSCVDSREKPLTDGLVGLRSVVMAEAALASARTGKAMTF